MNEQIKKIKTFVNDHKNEIILGTITVASIGFIAGAAIWSKNQPPIEIDENGEPRFVDTAVSENEEINSND